MEPGFDVNMIAEMQKIIESTKNARSHLEILKASLSVKTGLIYTGSMIISKEVISLYPVIYDFDDHLANKSESSNVAIFLISKEIVTIYP